jgi:hypothetical protein
MRGYSHDLSKRGSLECQSTCQSRDSRVVDGEFVPCKAVYIGSIPVRASTTLLIQQGFFLPTALTI